MAWDKTRKKIFYVPGMISLILIPLICIIYFFKTDSFKVYGVIQLGMPNKGDFEKYKVPTLRNYKVFNFSKSEFSERKNLNEMKLYLRKLMANKDTVNGIKVHYDSKTDYDVFIRTIDIVNIEKAPTWAIEGNDIYILASRNTSKKVKKESISHRMNCGTMAVMAERAYWEQKNKKDEEARIFEASFFKGKWISISLGYLGIAFINIFALVKFNKNKYYHQKRYI